MSIAHFKFHSRTDAHSIRDSKNLRKNSEITQLVSVIGRAHTTRENGKWGETKQRSENQVAFNSVLGLS
jgi:hypothetical protein